MLTILSLKYQKEVALVFLSLFLISGLGSLKAQASVNNFNVAGNYISHNKISGTSYIQNVFPENTVNEKQQQFVKDAGKTNISKMPEQVLLKLGNGGDSVSDHQIIEKIRFDKNDYSKKPLFGGPGQPEMSAFKPVGADNMADPFTGDFSYNVPLLDVGGYPVNMFYNSGITMDQESSWLGLGWNINPGTIMRNMRGLPDDFNGTDIITKRQSIKPDKTWGISAGAGIKFAGFPMTKVGLDVNTGISFNNKLGVATEAGIHPSLSISANAGDSKTASLSFGANLSASSRNGASVTPSIGLSLQKDLINSESRSGSIGLSYTQSSRAGVTGLHLDAGLSKSKDWDKNSASGFYKLKSLSGSEAALSSSISFAYPTVVPSIKSIFTRKSYNLSFSVGGEIFGLNGHGRLAGYYTESRIDDEDKETRHPAYGMLNYQKANNNPNALLDFNRANDGIYTPSSPAIAMPVYTYDIFSINGEGTGGSFRATRSDLGYMRDAYVKTKDDAASLGLDLGFGNTVHGGAEFSYANTPSDVGGWNVNNMAKNVFQFQENKGAYEAVYFKNPGEKTIPNAIFQDAIGGENLVRLKMSGTRSGTPILLPKLIKYDGSKNVVDEKELDAKSFTNLPRDKRTQVINFLNAEEADRIGFDRKIYSYDTDSNKIIFGAACNKTGIDSFDRFVAAQPASVDRKAHHISEVDVLGTDGRKYVYGIPVYNTRQVDVSFSVNKIDGNITTGKSNYEPGTDDTKDNIKGRDWFMNQEEMPAYTHSFLLTALVSPNYVDVSGDGITEDDMGDAVKFNYSRFDKGYKWRTPIEQGKASYSEGLKTDIKDDKAHYIYGEREMWHLYSVESKNMVARFYVKNDRLDCKQVVDSSGGLDKDWGMQRLDKISLYSKGDLMKLGNKAKPIKTVRFFQSYKLCPNTPNNNNKCVDINGALVNCIDSININKSEGKLTLDSIWISYNGNQKKAKSKYIFYYPTDKNPSYEYNGNDKWGNYKPTDKDLNKNPGALNNADFPYSIQDKPKADNYAASWVMNKILLPSGGIINVDFESDDYSYVQNKKAVNMFNIIGFGDKQNPNISANEQKNKFLFSPRGVKEYDYVYLQLTYPVITNPNDEARELAARYFENTRQLYMKIAVVMPSKPGLGGSELIPIYADIDNFGIVPGSQGKIAYVKVLRVNGGSTPMVQQALQFIKQQLPGKAYPGYDVSDESSAKGVVLALAGMITSVVALKMGEDAKLKSGNICREVETAKSFARLTNPYLTKYGGGLRVKKVTINDNWNKMTKQYEASYGQEYKYISRELVNGKLTNISSGVASWEPSMGGDENPHKEIMRYMNHNRGGPYDFGAIEMPLGEMFYPSPMVGYRRVEVLSIHRDTVKNLPTRQVTEFFTTKDFPFQSTCTQLSDPEANVKYEPSAIKQLLKLDMKKAITQSQGFLVDMNDMNGKVRIQATYSALDSVNAVSYTENFYNVKKATDNTYKFNHNFQTINNPQGVVDKNSLIGRDIELMADFRQHKTETITTNISVNFDFFFLGIFPIPLTNLLQPTIYEGTTYRSASLLKIVNHYGMLDSVVVIDKGSMVSTKNLVYDAETGNPILTRTNNEHNKPVYNFSYPAHWAYSGMGPAYKNIDANYTGLTFRNGKLETPIDMGIFESGDELFVRAKNNLGPRKSAPCDGAAPGWILKNNQNKIWAVNTAKAGPGTPQFIFMDRFGNPYTAADVTMRIVRSGHRNMLDQTVGTVTSLKNPVNQLTGQLELNDATNILQTSAATFKDHWRVDNSFYLKDSTVKTVSISWLKKIDLPLVSNIMIEKRRKANSKTDYINYYLNPGSVLAKSWDWGRNHSDYAAYSWMKFNYNSVPANLKIVHAKLSMFGHYQLSKFGVSTIHPDVHTDKFPHENPSGRVENSLGISRLNINGPSNQTDWKWVFEHDAAYHDATTSVFVNPTPDPPNQSYVAKDLNYYNDLVDQKYFDNRISVLGMVKKILEVKKTPQTADADWIRVKVLTSGTTPIGPINSRQCFWGLNSNTPPVISIYYEDCNNLTKSPGADIDALLNIPIPCPHVQDMSFCISKFTKKAINPYVEGILGNWRIDTAFVYYGDRKENDPGISIDTRTAGTIINFKKFWNFNPDYLQRNLSASDVWVWNSTITQYNRKGYEIENKDPLGRFNAGLYGYNQQLPVAVGNNARVREIMFDGFEDYDYQTSLDCISCKPHRHVNFDAIQNYIVDSVKHTGRYSIRLDGDKTINLKAPITNLGEADKGSGLRVKIDSTSFTDTTINFRGRGFSAEYYSYDSKNNCSDAANAASTILQTTSLTSKQDQQIYFSNKSSLVFNLPANVPYNRFAIKWNGYVQPNKSGFYSFYVTADDGFRFQLTDKNGNILASTQRWDCNWGSSRLVTTSQPLIRGELYKITMDYFEYKGGESVTLTWQTPGTSGYEIIPLNQVYSPANLSLASGTVTSTTTWCTKLDSVQVRSNALTDTFSLIQNKKMVLSAWVKEGGNDCKCSTYVNNGIIISYSGDSKTESLQPSGNIIEGWQRYESVFTIPENATAIQVSLKNHNGTGSAPVFFDDIRIHPFNANLKSFVYHSSNLRLMAELDENNYASFYEYDDDGTLTRVKKETVNGVKTITETRSAMQKIIQ